MSRRHRRFVATLFRVGAAGLIVIAGSVVAVDSGALSVNSSRITLVGLGGARLSSVPLHRNGVDVLGIALRYPGIAPTLDLRVPNGTRLHSLTSYDASSGRAMSGTWHCSTSARAMTTTCHYRTASSSAPSEEISYAVLVSGASSVTAGGYGRVSVNARLASGAVSSSLPVTFASSNVPDISVSRSATPVVEDGGTGSVAFEVQVRRGAALDAAGAPLVTISNALPTGVVRSWSLASSGWHCVGAPTSSPTCSYAAPSLAVGAATAPLVLRYVVRGDATTSTRTLAWTSNLLVSGPYGLTMSRGVASQVSLRTTAVGSLKVAVNPLGGQTVEPGSSRQVEIMHAASDGVASGLADTIVVPKGLRLLGEHMGGWTCPSGTGTLTCRHPAPILTSGPVPLTVTLSALSDAPRGFAIVAVLSRALDGSVKNAGLAMLDVGSLVAPRIAKNSPTTTPGGGLTLTPVTRAAPVLAATVLVAPTRSAHAQGITPTSVSLQSVPRVTSTLTPMTLGGVSLTSISGTIDSTTGTFTGTALGALDGATFNVNLTYTDSSNWSFTVQTSQTVLILGQSIAITGSMTDVAGAFSGALSVTLGSGAPFDGLTFSGTLSAVATSGTTPAFGGSITVGFNLSSLSATISYSDASDWSVQLASTDTLSFALSSSPGSLAVSGSISDTGGTFAGSISGSTTTPFTLVNGVSATGSLSFSFTNAAVSASSTSPFSFSGSMTLRVGSITLPVTFSYSDPNNWTATLAVTSSTGSLTITPTFSVPLSSLSGTVAMTQDGYVRWGVTAIVSSVDVVPNVATLAGVTISIGNSCSLDFGPCPPGANSVYVMVGGTLALTFAPGVSGSSLPFEAAYGMQTGGFDLTASVSGSPITLVSNVLSLSNPTLQISYNDPTYATLNGPIAVASGVGVSSGLNVLVAGTVILNFAGTSVTVSLQVAYSGGGFDIVGSTSDFNLGGTGAQINAIGYFTQGTTLSVNGTTVSAQPNTFLLAGTFTLPTALGNLLGDSATISVYTLYSGPTNFQISATLKMTVPVPSSSDFKFIFNAVTLTVGVGSGGPYFEFSTQGTLQISGSASPAATQNDAVTVAMTFNVVSATLGVSFSVTGIGGQPALANAFGYTDLTLNDLSFSAAVTFSTGIPTPSFGISASGTLPASVLSDLGIGTGVPVALGFTLNVSVANPCIQVSIGTPGGPSVISIGGGMLTASYATFTAAPAGCVVGTTDVPQGFAIAFSGTFLHVSVAFQAALTLSPTSFTGSASVSGFSVAGFTLQNSSIAVAITPTSFSFTFNGAIQILSPANQVNLSGSVDSIGDLKLRGSANITLDGFSLAANVIAERYGTTASVFASGSLNVMGQIVNISGFFDAVPSGVVGSLTGYAHVNISGYDLGNMTFNLALLPARGLGGPTIAPSQQLTAYAALNLGPLGAATLSGTFTHSGAQVGVYLSASVSANLGAVSTVSGTVTVGNCSDVSCANIGNFGASLAGSFSWQGTTYGFSGAAVAPSWNFSASSSGSVNTTSAPQNTGLDQYRAQFSGSYSVQISSSSPYVAFSSSVHAAIQHVGGHLKTDCTGNWDPKTWHCSTYVVWGSSWTTFINIGASMDSQGNLSASCFGRTYSVRI